MLLNQQSFAPLVRGSWNPSFLAAAVAAMVHLEGPTRAVRSNNRTVEGKRAIASTVSYTWCTLRESPLGVTRPLHSNIFPGHSRTISHGSRIAKHLAEDVRGVCEARVRWASWTARAHNGHTRLHAARRRTPAPLQHPSRLFQHQSPMGATLQNTRHMMHKMCEKRARAMDIGEHTCTQ